MKAIEAAEHSDILLETKTQMIVSKEGDNWFDDSGVVDISKLNSDNYVPIVPKKIYKVGDKADGIEAIRSGMCFAVGDIVYRWREQFLWQYVNEDQSWHLLNGVSLHWVANQVFTLVDDPSIPPKPTLESLPAWTRCKVRALNYDCDTLWDVVKKPSGSLMHYCNGNDFEWVNVELVAVYNPKTEQWEDV